MTEAVAETRAALARVAALPEPARARLVGDLPEGAVRALHDCWPLWAHPGQLPGHEDWSVWLIRAGRGFGKTRAGSEWVQAYRYRVGERVTRLAADAERPQVIHVRSFNPLDDHYGMGCLGAASAAVAVHNAAARWGKALLDNAARPSGALVYDPGDGSALSATQYERLRAELDAFSGAGNAGRPMLLEGGLKWQALSLSPAELDFAGTKAAAAREIALAFGVPPMLLGLPGDSTHANYREANRALWRMTVLPLAEELLTGIAQGLAGWFADRQRPAAARRHAVDRRHRPLRQRLPAARSRHRLADRPHEETLPAKRLPRLERGADQPHQHRILRRPLQPQHRLRRRHRRGDRRRIGHPALSRLYEGIRPGRRRAGPVDQFAANFSSLIASLLVTQPPIRLVA
ncbi:hypothetical protein GCM10011380_19850 [Sphingomonas metalli]|uniref:Phage portal protein n=1 Tax=Sphingomonas metalli TaxID=1779358 RepID=A0A916WTZ1_9SPHN|nr:hypothetical protein GCM10011380_19850 [Sphingomonas metalli]